MRPNIELYSAGLLGNKSFNNLLVSKNNSSKQSFEKFLINNKQDIGKDNKNQKSNEPNSDKNLRKSNSELTGNFAVISKKIVKYIDKDQSEQSDLRVENDMNLNEPELAAQLSKLADLIQELVQELQFINPNQGEETEGIDEQLTKNLAEINNMLNTLGNISENHPLFQELIAGLFLNNNNELINQELNTTLETLSLSTNNKDELVNVLNKLNENFKDLIIAKNDLDNRLNNNFNMLLNKEILSNVDEFISNVQPKLSLLEKIPAFLESAPLKDAQSLTADAESIKNSILDELNQKNHPKPIDILGTNKSLEKISNGPEELITINKEDLQQPIINNEFINKQQLNMQEIRNISKNQFSDLSNSKGAILDQLVRKATLMVKEGFSEMKMQLKPDFLGKVDLQISIERGIITAKFAAENQQVKELIEANLTNLKQNLTNQGLKIDQISVTIGNQQNLNDQSRRPYQQANSKNSKKFNLEEGDVYGTILSNELESITKHWYSDSTVDYTA